MRNILVFAMFLFCMNGLAQTPNEKVLSVANSLLGHRVGRGVCFELVDKCLCSVDPKWKQRKIRHSRYHYGKHISRRVLKPGDIVSYKWKSSYGSGNHIGIVYEIKDGQVILINQNVGVDNLKESIVVITPMLFEDMILVKARYYRPY